MYETLRLGAEHEGAVWHHDWTRRKWWMHHHAELELNLVTAGRARYLLGERRYDLRANTQVWLFPAQDHLLLDQSPDHRMLTIVFRPELLNRVCTDPTSAELRAADPPGYYCRHLATDQAAKLVALCHDIMAVQNDPALYNAGLAYLLLTAWAAFTAAERPSTHLDMHPAVEKAVQLIRADTDTLSAVELARYCGLSPSRLSKLFHEQTGVTLVHFRNRQRLERFLRLYGQGRRLSMLEAATHVGFGSYPQFHRTFKQFMGCAPAEYRRRQLGQDTRSVHAEGEWDEAGNEFDVETAGTP